MESLHGFLTAHWDHERTRIPLTRPSGTLSPTGGEGGGEGVRFMEREHLQDSDVSWGHEPPLGSAGVPPASSPGVPPGFRRFEFFPGGETPPEPAGGTPALRFMGSLHDFRIAHWDHEPGMVGTARCAVRAAFSGATVPPATARAGTSQRDVPTRVGS